MSRFIFSLALILVFSYFSCEKNDENKDNSFDAEVLGKNTDCGIFAVRFTDKTDQVRAIAETTSSENIYIAANLPVELQVAGLEIIVNIRKPNTSEVGICTTLGISYPWIYVTNARLK